MDKLSSFFGREISRDLIGNLRCSGMIASGPRSPTPGAPYIYVTTKEFMLHFGLNTLRDLSDSEMARRHRIVGQGAYDQ